MKIKYVPIGTIQPYPNNPRKNDKAVNTVADSIEQYGFQQPIVVDSDNVIVVGHTRYRAAKKLNLSEVPVIVADNLTKEQVNSYRIMDNKSNENSHWDDTLLFQELEQLLDNSSIQQVSWDTGFSEAELNKLFSPVEDLLTKYNLDEHYKSQTGEVWLLGDHKLLCGDSTDPQHLQLLLQDEPIDLLWEDPPYGVAYETANGINFSKEENELRNHKIKNDDLSPEQLDQFLDAHLQAVVAHLKPGAPVYWAHDIRFTQQFRDLLDRHNVFVSDTLIWKKNTHSTWLSDYAKYYEPILYGWKQGAQHPWYGKTWNPNAFALDELQDYTREQLIKLLQHQYTNYQEFNKEPRKIASIHPTVKPVKLIVYHILNSSKVGDIVFDGFSGSGSTLIAAERTNRKARCIEYEPKFVDATIKRWQEESGLQAVRMTDNVAWDDLDNIAGNQELQDAFFSGETPQ